MPYYHLTVLSDSLDSNITSASGFPATGFSSLPFVDVANIVPSPLRSLARHEIAFLYRTRNLPSSFAPIVSKAERPSAGAKYKYNLALVQ
jgi:hypothetical protein